MLKLLMCSSLCAPCIAIAFLGSSSASLKVETPGYEETFVTPELQRIENCETANIDIFFHDSFIEMHSAEYLSQAVELSDNCAQVNFTIEPIIPITSTKAQLALIDEQVEELVAVLDAHDVQAIVSEPKVQTDFDNLSANGRAAILSIQMSQSTQS